MRSISWPRSRPFSGLPELLLVFPLRISSSRRGKKSTRRRPDHGTCRGGRRAPTNVYPISFPPGKACVSRSCGLVFPISFPPVKASEDRGVRGSAFPTLPGSFSRMQTSLRTVRRVDTTARAQALNVPARSRGQPVPSPTMRQGYHLQMLSAVVPRTTDSRPRSFDRARDRRSDPAVPLVLRRIAVAKANAYR